LRTHRIGTLLQLILPCGSSPCRASRFIWTFICEYFLNTIESPCQSACVTHLSATPPALSGWHGTKVVQPDVGAFALP